MKKAIVMLVVIAISLVIFTGCSYVETETVEAEVVSCVEGRFVKNASYNALATQAMLNKDITKYSMYTNLAKTTGTQKYDVTIIVVFIIFIETLAFGPSMFAIPCRS